MASRRDIKNLGGRPATGKGTGVLVRLQPDQLAALDAFIAAQAKPLSRPEAIRKLMFLGLPRTVEVSVSDERHSWGGDAVMAGPKPKGLK
jgi:hypothetical protein